MEQDYYNTKIVAFENGHREVTKYAFPKIKPRPPDSSAPPKRLHLKTEEELELDNQRKLARVKQTIRYYCTANAFDLFWTLTFNDEKVDAKHYDHAIQQLRAWLKYMREKFGKFDYLFIPELHQSGRIHFHGLTGGFFPPLTEARNQNTNRLIRKNGKQVYNAPTWKNGYSTVSRIDNQMATANYIAKYISKDLLQLNLGKGKHSYFVSRGLKKPEIYYRLVDKTTFEEFVPSFFLGELTNNLTVEPILARYLLTNDNGTLTQNHIGDTVAKIKSHRPICRENDDL